MNVVSAPNLRAPHSAELPEDLSRFRLTYVIGTYPRLTTTFIDREIRVLRRLGFPLQVVSIRHPKGFLSAEQRRLQADIHYVLPASARDVLWSHLSMVASRPVQYVRTFFYLVSRPHPTVATRMRTILHFGLGVHIARILRDRYPTDHIHAHFVDRAALVALIVGRLLRIPFSATAHGTDIYVNPALLPEKLAEAKFIAAISRYSEDQLRAIVPDGSVPSLRCLYNGIELGRYRPKERERPEVALLLAVGQLKETKGFPVLLQACAHLSDLGYEFKCHIVGEGPLGHHLEETVDHLRLRDCVSMLGPLSHDVVMEKYEDASIFVLPCITGSDGARDGIPTVILEAMAMRLPVVSTELSGIPEAVQHGTTGLLVEPNDPMALANALRQLLDDDELCKRMGIQGRRRVAETFDSEKNVRALLAEFMS
jgi:glycosyltransferase involved in cell wall biosynthesis